MTYIWLQYCEHGYLKVIPYWTVVPIMLHTKLWYCYLNIVTEYFTPKL